MERTVDRIVRFHQVADDAAHDRVLAVGLAVVSGMLSLLMVF